VITTFTDPAGFEAAATGLTVDDFQGYAPSGGQTSYTSASGVSQNGVEFIGYTSTPGSYLIYVVSASAVQWAPYSPNGNSNALQLAPGGPSDNGGAYVQIALPAQVTAAGMDLVGTHAGGLSYDVSINGTPFTVAANSDAVPNFIGVTSSAPISTITISLDGTVPTDGAVYLDNFQFGAASAAAGMDPAPEATPFVLIGSGLIGLIGFRKKFGAD
jgi:hypothetical protein